MHAYTHWIAAAVILSVFAMPAQSQSVSKVEKLYAAVNDPKNAGNVVLLTPGVYTLDPSQPNGGRLELQPNMTLRGLVGDSAAVVIDASALTSYQTGGFMTGAIRMGLGTNAIEWLTVSGSSGAANIETDLSSSDYPNAVVRISHVVSRNAVRGIDVRNVGVLQAQRTIDAYLDNNLTSGNTAGEGMGIRIVNTNGASGATIDATLVANEFSGNRVGLVADNLTTTPNPATAPSTIGSAVKVRSSADRFTHNGTGAIIMGGVSLVGTTTNSNLVTFDAEDDAFTANNTGLLVPGFPAGGIVAYGALNGSSLADPTNSNAAVVTLIRPQFGGNQNADVVPFGAASGNQTTLPGTNNHAFVVLQGASAVTSVSVPVSSDPFYPAGGNTAVVVK